MASLLQIAIEGRVYIIDLLVLRSKEACDHISAIMSSPDLVKLGFGFKGDVLAILRRMGAPSMVG